MYVGNVLLVAGFLVAFGRVEAALIGLVCCVLAYSAIIANEESFLRRKFGDEFVSYCKRVPRWMVDMRGLWSTLRHQSADVKVILLREYSTLSVTTLGATLLAVWRLHDGDWGSIEFAISGVVVGAVLGFYLTMRFLERKRIVYAPR